MSGTKISANTIIALSMACMWLLAAGCNLIQLALPGILCLVVSEYVARAFRKTA